MRLSHLELSSKDNVPKLGRDPVSKVAISIVVLHVVELQVLEVARFWRRMVHEVVRKVVDYVAYQKPKLHCRLEDFRDNCFKNWPQNADEDHIAKRHWED